MLAVYAARWKALQSAYACGDPADPSFEHYAVEPSPPADRAERRA